MIDFLDMVPFACLMHWYISMMYVVPVVAVGGWGWLELQAHGATQGRRKIRQRRAFGWSRRRWLRHGHARLRRASALIAGSLGALYF